MINNITAARPYAKAIFDLALQSGKLEEWQYVLKDLAMLALECEKQGLLDNPLIAPDQKIKFFSDIDANPHGVTNLLVLLASRKKLALIPSIASAYKKLLYVRDNILEAKVISASQLSQEQEASIVKALKERYKCKISLVCKVDKQLIGGAVIHVANGVIDGSIKGMLQNLKYNLLMRN